MNQKKYDLVILVIIKRSNSLLSYGKLGIVCGMLLAIVILINSFY